MVIKRTTLEFKDFIKEYKIVSMAIAFIMGFASRDLVKSLVDDIIMPILNPVLPGADLSEATLTMGSIVIKWGAFLAELITFVILAFVVFIIAKKLLREEKVGKK